MTNDLPIELLLDDYLKGDINRAGLTEKLPQLDEAELDHMITGHRSAVVFLQRASVLSQVENIHRQFLNEKSATRKKTGIVLSFTLRKLMSVAAVLIVAVGTFIWFQWQNPSPSGLYQDIYSGYTLSAYRSGETTTEPLAELYENKSYQELVNQYERLSSPTPREQFLAGMSYLELENFVMAGTCFDSILAGTAAGEKLLYRDEAEFYGGLATLRTGDYNKAYQLLNKVVRDREHTYHAGITEKQLRQIGKLARK